MICISCKTEINPKWKAAIDKNECPFCGEVILDEELKELLSSLHALFVELQEYPNELNDWLLSNFQYIKTDSEKLVDYVSPELLQKKPMPALVSKRTEIVKDEKGEQEVVIEKTQTSEETNGFYARAFNKKPGTDVANETADRTFKFKEIADKIKRSGNTNIDDEEGEVEGNANFDAEYAEIMKNQSNLPTNSSEEDLPPIIANQIAMGDTPKTSADFKVMQRIKMREEGVPSEVGKNSFSRSS